MPAYKTIAKASEAIFRDRGSKFLGYAYPVYTEEDINQCLDEIRSQHPKATHHCYAWRIGLDGNAFRANDDGEPSGSAGLPILGQIDSFELANVLIVVVRYYGGTKLGVSGLIHAYKTAASQTLENASIIKRKVMEHVQVAFEYPQMNDVMNYLKTNDIEILDKQFELSCCMTIALDVDEKEQHCSYLQSLENLSLSEC